MSDSKVWLPVVVQLQWSRHGKRWTGSNAVTALTSLVFAPAVMPVALTLPTIFCPPHSFVAVTALPPSATTAIRYAVTSAPAACGASSWGESA